MNLAETQKPLPDPQNGSKGRNRLLPALSFLVLVLTLAGSWLIFGTYTIPSGSMAPTLQGSAQEGDRIWANKTAYWGEKTPEYGDVVLFRPSGAWIGPYTSGDVIVKRVIATEGQTVAVDDDGQVTVDGETLDEPYVGGRYGFSTGILDCGTDPASQACFPEVTVPENHVWVMGDNRTDSMDSTAGCRGQNDNPEDCLGPVPEEDVFAQVRGVLLPSDRYGAPLGP